MKIRVGFVGNSSSSSFIIRKEYLTARMISRIRNHIEESEGDMDGVSPEDAWVISEDEESLEGSTSMDNFDMHYFLTRVIKLDEDVIEWSD